MFEDMDKKHALLLGGVAVVGISAIFLRSRNNGGGTNSVQGIKEPSFANKTVYVPTSQYDIHYTYDGTDKKAINNITNDPSKITPSMGSIPEVNPVTPSKPVASIFSSPAPSPVVLKTATVNAVDLNNEKTYLQAVASQGGGSKIWAETKAKSYGVALDKDTKGLDLNNEKTYLEGIAKQGGGSKIWAEAQADKYGITLGVH